MDHSTPPWVGGIPGHDDVGEQAQRIGDSLHVIVALRLIASDATGVDGAL